MNKVNSISPSNQASFRLSYKLSNLVTSACKKIMITLRLGKTITIFHRCYLQNFPLVETPNITLGFIKKINIFSLLKQIVGHINLIAHIPAKVKLPTLHSLMSQLPNDEEMREGCVEPKKIKGKKALDQSKINLIKNEYHCSIYCTVVFILWLLNKLNEIFDSSLN